MEHANQIHHARHGRDWNDLETVARHDRGDELVLDAEVFNQGRVGRQRLLNAFERTDRVAQAQTFSHARRRNLAEGAKELVLVCQRLFLKLLNSLRGRIIGPQLLDLNSAVIPIEFLAHFADSAYQLALASVTGRKRVAMLHEKLGQAS